MADETDTPTAAGIPKTPAARKPRNAAPKVPKASTRGSRSTPAPRAQVSWSTVDCEKLVDTLDELKDGETSEGGFQKGVWKKVADAFDDPLKTNKSCKSKYNRLKKEYKEVKTVVEYSGFGWDDINKLPTAITGVWEDIEKV